MSTAADSGPTAAAIIRAMTSRLGQISEAVQLELLSQIPELRGDARLVDLLHDSVEGNVATIFAAIANDIPPGGVTPPTAALEYARRLAQHDVSPNALVRAYRLGQQELLRLVLDEIRARKIDPVLALATFEAVNISASGYIDWISEQVVDVYQAERDRWRESRDRILAERIRTFLLDDVTTSADDATISLRYPMSRHHLAVILWYPEAAEQGELSGMEQFLLAAADHVGASDRPLFVANDRVTAWAWIPLHQNASAVAASRLTAFADRYPGAPSVAVGEPRPGIDGFRRSHQLAGYARAVALADESGRTSIVSDQPGVMIAAMLDGDLSNADVWVCEVLGDLASSNDADANLRETVRVFLECGASFKDAAARLHLHSNTVKYRVRRAEERRGRPLEDGRLDVEIALLLCARFPALLAPRQP